MGVIYKNYLCELSIRVTYVSYQFELSMLVICMSYLCLFITCVTTRGQPLNVEAPRF